MAGDVGIQATRQQTPATSGLSYNLLSETERLTLLRLAVFVGAFSGSGVGRCRENLDSAWRTEMILRHTRRKIARDSGCGRCRCAIDF